MTHGEEFSNTLLVKVEGSALSDDVATQLVSGYVDASNRVPDLFVLRFNDENGTVLTKAGIEIGKPVEIGMQNTAPDAPEPLLVGEVTAVEVEVTEAGMHTVVRGLDLAHRLYRGTRVEAYVNMTASDIVDKVARRVELETEIDPTSTMLDHTTQANENDWDFLSRLAVEHDRVLTVAAGKLQFIQRAEAGEAPDATDARNEPLVIEQGVNLVQLRATITSSGQVPAVQVRGWDPAQQQPVVADATSRTLSAETESGTTPEDVARAFDSPTYVDGTATISDDGIARSRAESLADHLAGGFAEIEGTVRGNPALRAGTAIKLVGVGDPFQGRYVLTSAHHDFGAETGYRTGFVASNKSERSLYGASSAGDATQRSTGGLMPAVVTSAQDPAALGRVKIKLPWLSDGYESGWARVLQPGAGADRGMVWLPEVGDEVLVAFAHDDLGHPYVVGGLYNGVDEPHGGWAEHVDGNNGSIIRRALVSRSGMLVEFREKSGDEHLVVSTNDGAQRIALHQSEKGIEIVSEGPVEVTAQQEVAVTAQRDISLSAPSGTINLEAMNVAVEATGNLDLKGVNVKVNADAAAELAGNATTTVRGGMVRIN